MYKHLKAMNHKGVKKIVLDDLGYINILCGKNDSGKTSILEALNASTINKRTIGRKIDSSCIGTGSRNLFRNSFSTVLL
jgi:AAA15 family ATPase/GTPase